MSTLQDLESQLRNRLRRHGYRIASFGISTRETNTYSLGIEFSNIRGNPGEEEKRKAKKILLGELNDLKVLNSLRDKETYMLCDPGSVHWRMYVHFSKKELDHLLITQPGIILVRS
jgi:hypothetical protein